MSNETILQGPTFGPANGENAKKLVILLHGLGANGADLIGLAPFLSDVLPEVEFLAPNAPQACDMAPVGYQWFSLQDRSPAAIEAGVRAAAPLVINYIEHHLEKRSLKYSDIALLGFSQGCMMSLFVGFRLQNKIAAILGYSGALVASEKLVSEATNRPPVLLIHGESDPVVPFDRLEEARKGLESAGIDVQTLSRPGLGHGIDEEGIRAGAELLKTALVVSD
ncbi:MAG: phospholipase [Alphaproteobacteria bacterium]|jgi:phospholipase/carboxylesterase|nr:phospholipase [Alphaproteobacteria bacterium]PPR12805.1 MAG: Carboxylesterase 2 [Alphaproteobacteria bacterium MarineAlpha12_Bin1]|tara:strand:- start:2482 stop:3150 length:669 start_codon:yes stop_codon:yes gene_type:complete